MKNGKLKSWSAAASIAAVSAAVALAATLSAQDTNVKRQSGQQVTFSKDVAPIFQEKCDSCHHAGTSAPMSLLTYKEARPWARSIKQRTMSRDMPPWHLDKTVGVREFKNDISLPNDQTATTGKGVDEGPQKANPENIP